MNQAIKNILQSLCGNYVGVDVETTAIAPREGSIISMGFVPFILSLRESDSFPQIEIQWNSINEFWFECVNADSIKKVYGHRETIEWHINKNEAFPMYEKAAHIAGPADLIKLQDAFNSFFKVGKYNFLSRHAFDANWLEEKHKELFECIHYRNFVDIANIIKGTGIIDKTLYRTLETEAIDKAKEYQTIKLPEFVIPCSNEFAKHRAISDCLIDAFFMNEIMLYLWRNKG